MQAVGHLEILFVVGVVRKYMLQIVLVIPRQTRGQPDRSEAIGLHAGPFAIREAGIKMQAQKKIGIGALRQGHPLRQRQVQIIRPGEQDLPAIGQKQVAQTHCPVEGVFFFKFNFNTSSCIDFLFSFLYLLKEWVV